MYSVVMVVAMAGAPEVPSDCCFKDKFCCWKDKWQDKCCWKDKCGQKDYGCAKQECAPVAAPVYVAPAHQAPVAVAAAPCAQQSNGCDQGYSKKKKCCFFSCCDKGYSNNDCGKSKSCCDKGSSNNGCCDKGYSNKGCCDKGYSNNDCGKSKKCCFFSCCDKGGNNNYYTEAPACGTVVVPPTVEAPKKDMPKVDPKGGKVGG